MNVADVIVEFRHPVRFAIEPLVFGSRHERFIPTTLSCESNCRAAATQGVVHRMVTLGRFLCQAASIAVVQYS